MARTKQAARGGSFNKRHRPQNSNSDGPPPTKKAKKNPPPPSSTTDNSNPPTELLQEPSTTTASQILNTDAGPSSSSLDLARTHEITTMSITSSSHIQQKVTRLLDILSAYPPKDKEKPKVVMLHAKAGCATKMISIAEIAKREVVKEGGKWFQYNRVEGVMVEIKTDVKIEPAGKGAMDEVEVGKGERDGDEEDGDEREEETTAFETMKTPFERANEGKEKIRAVPVMSLFLSRERIEGLRRAYGEQTNALPVQKERA